MEEFNTCTTVCIHLQGTLTSTDVKAKFVNGKPSLIEARYNMRSQFEWDRFMRFMDRCAFYDGSMSLHT